MIRSVALGLLLCHGARSLSLSRRQALLHTGLASSAGLLLGTSAAPPAQAARGAAELDVEYYLRDLVGGNLRQGTVAASAPLAAHPPRVLKDPLRTALLTEDFGLASIPVQTLVSQLGRQGARRRPADAVLREIQEKAHTLRDKVSRSFAARAPWQVATTADQYYMDVSAYALWRTAADLLPDYADREVFVRTLGRNLYQRLRTEMPPTPAPSTTSRPSLVASLPEVTQVLDLLRESNFIQDYRLGEDPPGNQPQPLPVADELDDEALAAGGAVDLLVRVMGTATLGAALQINGEGSRFSPDFVGPTLAALWEERAGLACTWETFFIDPVYRPNPKDYYPTEQLWQFTLRMR
jgi:hypothetical protein